MFYIYHPIFNGFNQQSSLASENNYWNYSKKKKYLYLSSYGLYQDDRLFIKPIEIGCSNGLSYLLFPSTFIPLPNLIISQLLNLLLTVI